MTRASTPWGEIRAQLLANPKVKAAYEALGRKHMRIALELIKDSPRPIRTSWDEDALNELAKSIAEQGVIVPIKVRMPDLEDHCQHGPNAGGGRMTCLEHEEWVQERVGSQDDSSFTDLCPWCWFTKYGYRIEDDEDDPIPADWKPYEIVYGHRRVEAARRAGLTEIDAIVEGVDDTAALVQALIENVQREDMTPLDKARALKALMEETGWSQAELGRQGIVDRQSAGQLLALLNLPADIQQSIGGDSGHVGPGHRESPLTPRHVLDALPADDHQHDVLRKAAQEGLTARQTRAVAETVAKTIDPERRKALLATPYSPFIHNPDMAEAGERAERITRSIEGEDRYREAPEITIVLEQIKKLREAMRLSAEAVEMGKASPEARRFIGRRMIDLGQELIKRGEALSS